VTKHRKRQKLHHGLPAEVIDWNRVGWGVVLANAPMQAGLHTAESLHPSIRTIERALFGRSAEARESARIIIDSWAFRFPVTQVRA
jgi:hypothetical protein